MTLSVDERIDLVKQVAEELIDENDLRALFEEKLEKGEKIYAYDGFEPSGNIHIAQGLLRAINVNKLIKSGMTFIFLVADWHAAANEKFGGDLKTIKKVGEYFIEVWKACDMDLDHVEFKWASDLVEDPKYWEMVLQLSMKTTLKRALRTTQIMGRSETDDLKASQILYPMMQNADIFYMDIDVCQLGMDQRKVNMLARETAKFFDRPKPIAVHHHMLAGLKEPPKSDLTTIDRAVEIKMSKSDPDSAIFMLDTFDDISRKIKKAWCPEKQIEENPVLEYCNYIIFEKYDEMIITRPEKFGGDLIFSSYKSLEEAFASGDLHPADLKKAVAKYLDELLEPVRQHFKSDPKAKKLAGFVKKAVKKQYESK
ncbi:MAG: tyrosine--tRNA ligase [Candidatus Heimdallarchaeota archaeon]|nr:tyrosine--tRNA ligase [Candidatus Heimdallarchaeota archaeon]